MLSHEEMSRDEDDQEAKIKVLLAENKALKQRNKELQGLLDEVRSPKPASSSEEPRSSYTSSLISADLSLSPRFDFFHFCLIFILTLFNNNFTFK